MKQKSNKTDIEAAALAATEQISAAAKAATLVISDAALSATQLLAAQTSEAAKIVNVKGADDHDLIIELKTIIIGIKADIAELKDGTSHRIAALETEKLDTKDSYPVLYRAGVEKSFQDHEDRMRALEQKIWIWVGVSTVLVFLVPIFLKIFFKI